MVTKHTRGKVVWVDLESPTRHELRDTMHEFGIDARIEEEIATVTPYPLVISSPKYAYLILHFPTTDAAGGARSQEIDFIIGKHFLITSRYEVIQSIHNLHKVFEAEELLGLPRATTASDALLERVMRRMYAALREEVETIGTRLEHIEHDIFSGKERKTMRTISEVNRVLLRFDTTLARHEEALSEFLAQLSTPAFFGKEFKARAAHIEAEREHVAALVNSYREVASELRDTNDSLLSSSQNEVMKNLTVVASIILPLSLIADIFQVDLPDVPFIHGPHAFLDFIGILLAIAVVLVLFAKARKWL
jgi:magnesium transporter